MMPHRARVVDEGLSMILKVIDMGGVDRRFGWKGKGDFESGIH